MFGTGFLLHQVQVIDFPDALSTWWPVIFIIIGIIQMFYRYSFVLSGFLFVLVGAAFLFNHLFNFNLIAYFWSLLFIFIGIFIIFACVTCEKRSHISEILNTFTFLSGAEIKSHSKNLRGGSVTTILGGSEIDLREVDIQEGTTIDLTTVLGGISLTVQEYVHLEFSGLPILGGWEDNTRIRRENDKHVVLKLNC